MVAAPEQASESHADASNSPEEDAKAEAARKAAEEKARKEEEKNVFLKQRAAARSKANDSKAPGWLFGYLLERWDEADWERSKGSADPEDLSASPTDLKSAFVGRTATGEHGASYVVIPAYAILLLLMCFFAFWFTVKLALYSTALIIGYGATVTSDGGGVTKGVISAVVGVAAVSLLIVTCSGMTGSSGSSSGCSGKSGSSVCEELKAKYDRCMDGTEDSSGLTAYCYSKFGGDRKCCLDGVVKSHSLYATSGKEKTEKIKEFEACFNVTAHGY